MGDMNIIVLIIILVLGIIVFIYGSNTWDIIIVLIITMVIGYILYMQSHNDMVYVKSNIDGESYLVRDMPDKQLTANQLSKIRGNMLSLTDYLVKNKSNYPTYAKYIDLLNSKIRNSVIMENGEDSVYTSYSVNKGEQIVFCLRSRKDKDNIHDLNLMMYVVIHEMAHVGCPSIGHTDEFRMIFAFFTKEAIKLGLYKKIDFKENPVEYCGMTVSESII